MAEANHLKYLSLALEEAKKSPPKPTNYCVGAVLVDSATDSILTTGYTLELQGNTHAEQCALGKFAASHGLSPEQVSDALPNSTVIYTTMEPCIFRLSGNAPCVERIIAAKKIKKVYVGVREPEKFVGENAGRKRLEDEGIEYVHVTGLEEGILKVATAGHQKDN